MPLAMVAPVLVVAGWLPSPGAAYTPLLDDESELWLLVLFGNPPVIPGLETWLGIAPLAPNCWAAAGLKPGWPGNMPG
jgi:hypothetical protein